VTTLSELPIGKRGELDVLSPASPAAGANFAFTVGGLSVVGAVWNYATSSVFTWRAKTK